MSRPTSRQELYDRIRQSSKDEVILEEMVRLGFWPKDKEHPFDSAEEIRKRGELERRLQALRSEHGRLHNIAAIEREARKRRLLESRRRRQQTKQRKLKQRAERAAAWQARKQTDILYLGPDVSAGLGQHQGDDPRLQKNGLTRLHTAADIADAMAITVGELRFLAFARPTSRITHYQCFKIPKRTGGERLISAPMPRLRTAQRWILDHILHKREPHPAAHGFRPGRSIVSNARPHVGADVVVNMDLQDFFPTVSYRRVKGLFRHLGYSEAASTIFGLLCTEPEIMETELDGITYHVSTSERFLPQGAPTSPAVTNLLCTRLDRRIVGSCQKLGFTYTRYADDLSFSGSGEHTVANVGRLLRQAAWIVQQEGFHVHPDKTRVFRKSRRQEVTGIVVNQRTNIARSTLKRFRATLYQIEKDGPEGKHWGQSMRTGDVIASVLGFANYVAMVDPERGRELVRRVHVLVERHGTKLPPPDRDGPGPDQKSSNSGQPMHEDRLSPSTAQSVEDRGEKPKKKWWKIF